MLSQRRAILSGRAGFDPLRYSFRNGVAIAAWWAAEDYTKMVDDGAGLISSWSDRITALAVTATTTARPTWSATSFDGNQPGVTFDGTANALVTTTLTAIPTSGLASELWVIGKSSDVAGTSTALCYGAQTAGQFRRLSISATEKVLVSDGTTNNQYGGAITAINPCVMTGQMFSTTENCWLNGLASASNPTTIGALATATTRLRIAANSSTTAGAFWTGIVSDALVLSGTTTDNDRQKLEGYFAWKYGFHQTLTTGHPYLFTPPTA